MSLTPEQLEDRDKLVVVCVEESLELVNIMDATERDFADPDTPALRMERIVRTTLGIADQWQGRPIEKSG